MPQLKERHAESFVVLTLFFLSGCSGLIYEVVWLRMLVRAFGSTTFATSTILAVFMSGLAAGAWLGGLRSRTAPARLRSYGIVELGLAVAAALATWGGRELPNVVAAFWSEQGAASAMVIVLRASLSFLILFVPTLLMGASFPLLAEHFSRARNGTRTPGWDRAALLYGVNTVGAVAGVIYSGFLAIGTLGEIKAVAIAVAINARRASTFCALQVAAGLLAAATLELYLTQGMARLDGAYLYSPIQSAKDFLALFGLSAGIIIPVTLVYGMMFPLAIQIADTRAAGTSVGRIYAFNTVGSVLGSLACGFVLIPALAPRTPLDLVAFVHLALGLIVASLHPTPVLKKVPLAGMP